jgi:rare lipoprotein A (peptidoglycan hydrolase)
VATWYSYVPGRCATWYLPKGTRITVTDLQTGKSISCIITDRESPGSNRVVDLNETQFAELAPLSQGVISVKVSW